jgi:hypothetical protein
MTVPKRFGVLRFFGTLLKVIAWVFLVAGILVAIGLVVTGSISGVTDFLGPDTGLGGLLTGIGGAIIAGIGAILGGLLYFLVFYVAGESLHLQLAVEENTRLTAALLLRMHQDGQGDVPSTYGAGGGFVSEPFEN